MVSIAKHYQHQRLSLGDLINEGNLGLIKATRRFDETRGFKFISYAVWWIRQSIQAALAEQSRVVRLPVNRIGALSQIGKAVSQLEQDFEREPSTTEIGDALDMTPYEVSDTLTISGRHLSLDVPLHQGAAIRLLDVMHDDQQSPPDSMLMTESLKVAVEHALASLTQREAEVVKLYFGLDREHPMTLGEIGERLHLTRERIRQIKEKALLRLRHTARSHALRPYLEPDR